MDGLTSGDTTLMSYEDLRWQYGVFRSKVVGKGRSKKITSYYNVMTNLGEIEQDQWCRLAKALIERDHETWLLNCLREWEATHNYTGRTEQGILQEALILHIARIFDDPCWVGYIPFNKKYRPEALKDAHLVRVKTSCCGTPGLVTKEQVDHRTNGTIPCPHCGRWSEYTSL